MNRRNAPRPHRRAASRLTAVAVGVWLLAGCTDSGGSDPTPTPQGGSPSAYQVVECPDDVAGAIPATTECGHLSVPQNRETDEGDLQILVTSIAAPAGSEELEPIVVVSMGVPNYAGIAPLAQRTRRRVLLLEPRGTRRLSPDLTCPETQVSWTDPTGGKAWLRKLRATVTACAAVMADAGADPSVYNPHAMAADIIDLLDALEIEGVNLISYDAASLVSLALMAEHSDRLRAVVMDSPDLPGLDPRPLVPGQVHEAVSQVLAWCADDPDCVPGVTDPTTLLDDALTVLADRPWTLQVGFLAGRQGVRLDPALLVRAVRYAFTDGGSSGPWTLPTSVPGLLAAVVRGDRSEVATALGELLGQQGPLCPGYRTKCLPVHVFDPALAWSVLCNDMAPYGPARSPRVPWAGFREAYTHAPWWAEVCGHWPGGPEHAAPPGPVRSAVPTLLLVGGLAPTTPAELVRKGSRGMTSSSVVVVPTGSHNVMGASCAVEIRDMWLDDPQPLVRQPDCLDQRVEW